MATDDAQTQSELEVIALADLEDINVNSLLAGNDGSDTFALTKPFRKARDEAERAGEEGRRSALGLLHDVLNIHLKVHDRAEPFGPMFQGPEGRTCTASDFRGEQSTIFAEFAETVEHPVLKARLADVAWYNERRRGDVGKLAVEAYCEIIKRRLAGLDAVGLSNAVRSEHFGSTRQLVSLWLLHGTDRLRSRQLVTIAGQGQRGLLRLLIDQSAPLIFHYIVRMGLSRCRDSLVMPYVMLAKFADTHPILQTFPHAMPKPEMIDSYPSFAYDMHTRLGKSALKQAEASCKAQLCAAGVRSFGNLVFALEGGCLDRRLSSEAIEMIRSRAIALEVFGREGSSANRYLAGLNPIPQIDEFRRQAAVSA